MECFAVFLPNSDNSTYRVLVDPKGSPQRPLIVWLFPLAALVRLD